MKTSTESTQAAESAQLSQEELNRNLLCAAEAGLTEQVKGYLHQDADINAKDQAGDTPLHLAVWNGYTETVELLLERGADFNATNKLGETPLHKAASKAENADVMVNAVHDGIMKILLRKGADVNAQDSAKCTPLHKAVAVGNVASVDRLLKKGAIIRIRNKDDKTAFNIAYEETFDRKRFGFSDGQVAEVKPYNKEIFILFAQHLSVLDKEEESGHMALRRSQDSRPPSRSPLSPSSPAGYSSSPDVPRSSLGGYSSSPNNQRRPITQPPSPLNPSSPKQGGTPGL